MSSEMGTEMEQHRYESATNERTDVIMGLRAISGHSGRQPLGLPPFINRVEVLYRHIRFFLWHATKNVIMKSVTESGLLVGDHRKSRRDAMFFCIVDPCQSSIASNVLGQSTLMSQMCAGTPIFSHYFYRGATAFRIDALQRHAFGIKLPQTVAYAAMCSENTPVRCLIDCIAIPSKSGLWDQSIKDACISDPEAEAETCLEHIMPPVGTLIQDASPNGE